MDLAQLRKCNCDTPKQDIRIYTDQLSGKVSVDCDWCGQSSGEQNSREEAIKVWDKGERK